MQFVFFFTGTTERVCLITGSVEAMMSVMDFIMEKIREKPDLTTKTTIDFESGKAVADRDKQVLLINTSLTAFTFFSNKILNQVS